MRGINLWLLAIFYGAAGVNHFINPDGYVKMIPSAAGNAVTLNLIAGAAEVAFGILVLFRQTRYIACIGIVLMLLAFLPVHIRMIKTGFCKGEFCVPQWALWVRLVLLQPLLILWAWKKRNA